jgi:hypothetical protein
MSEISRFLGIVIHMYYAEHAPPHFHAHYGEFRLAVEIESGITRGEFPRRKQAAVLAWARVHRQELLDNWARIPVGEPFRRIAPME